MPRASPHRRPAFSLIEMLATVAALVIVLGLMVSLARYVRRQASDQLTKHLLAQLDVLMEQYKTRYRALPQVSAFVPGTDAGIGAGETRKEESGEPAPQVPSLPVPLVPAPTDETLPDESTLQQNALANNREVVGALRVEARRRPDQFGTLPASFFDEGVLPDAWGTPIVFMPALHPAIGMAMENRPFFLSAGPDRQFRTLEDNLYSYETGLERGKSE